MSIKEILDNYGNIISFSFLLVILLVYLWYTFAIIYHFLRFGIGARPKILAIIFFMGSFFLFALTLNSYSEVNWVEILNKILTPPSA